MRHGIGISFVLFLAFVAAGCGDDASSGPHDAPSITDSADATKRAAPAPAPTPRAPIENRDADAEVDEPVPSATAQAADTDLETAAPLPPAPVATPMTTAPEAPETDAPSPPAPPKPEAPKEAETCVKADARTCAIEAEILRLTNELRAASGLAALTNDPKLAYVARSWSAEQAASGTVSHDGFPAARNTLYKKTFGTTAPINAENCAMFGGQTPEDKIVAKTLFDLWRKSPGHRANMLGKSRTIGIGVARNGSGFETYGTQIFAQ